VCVDLKPSGSRRGSFSRRRASLPMQHGARGRRVAVGSQTRHTTDRRLAPHHRRGGTFSRLGHSGPSSFEETASHLSPNSPAANPPAPGAWTCNHRLRPVAGPSFCVGRLYRHRLPRSSRRRHALGRRARHLCHYRLQRRVAVARRLGQMKRGLGAEQDPPSASNPSIRNELGGIASRTGAVDGWGRVGLPVKRRS
jgi:hypothetical protein